MVIVRHVCFCADLVALVIVRYMFIAVRTWLLWLLIGTLLLLCMRGCYVYFSAHFCFCADSVAMVIVGYMFVFVRTWLLWLLLGTCLLLCVLGCYVYC